MTDLLGRASAANDGTCPCRVNPHLRRFGAFQRGPFNATTYDYPDRDSMHLRLDDGHQFACAEIDGCYQPGAWSRLEGDLIATIEASASEVRRNSG